MKKSFVTKENYNKVYNFVNSYTNDGKGVMIQGWTTTEKSLTITVLDGSKITFTREEVVQ